MPRSMFTSGRPRSRFTPTRALIIAVLVTLGAVGVGAVATPDGPDTGPTATTLAGPTDPVLAPSASPGPTPAGAPSPARPPPPPGRDELISELERLVARAESELSAATMTVAVIDEHGRTLIEHGARVGLLPASTEKVVTAAAALEVLGPDHRFETRAVASGPISADGTLRGDLVIVGAGDPVLATRAYHRWVYPSRPRTPLETLAKRIARAGITRITGDLVADASAWTDSPTAPGWKDEYLQDFNARRISGLTVDAGLQVEVPGPELHVAPDPARRTVVMLRRALRQREVQVSGVVRAGTGTGVGGEEVAAVTSPPLTELLRHALERSDNPLADQLFAALGMATGDGTWEGSSRAALDALSSYGLPVAGVELADGSGLSRATRVTAGLLARIDAAMSAGTNAASWWDAMAAAGEDGTMRGRLLGTEAEGRFLAKTGTLDDVVAIVGSVHPRADPQPGTPRYHLAVIVNDARGADRTVAYVLEDELARTLAADLDGCRRTTVGAGRRGAALLGKRRTRC